MNVHVDVEVSGLSSSDTNNDETRVNKAGAWASRITVVVNLWQRDDGNDMALTPHTTHYTLHTICILPQ
jgi:hypothetical protein